MRKFVEGQTMVYDKKGKETLGKGPIILCLDESGSMRDLESQSKGFALALISYAKKQKRDFALISFSNFLKEKAQH
ncbi:vWA domain-containing protein [Virgibacillus sp. L01]|uniref:vWA domain-containing protein n=1 Tax=Virgibacillus sp. L01 TaxID=3457429 RepID=UPI003FD0CE26